MASQLHGDVRPCSAPACWRVLLQLADDPSRSQVQGFPRVVALCASYCALAAVSRELWQLLDISVVEVGEPPPGRAT